MMAVVGRRQGKRDAKKRIIKVFLYALLLFLLSFVVLWSVYYVTRQAIWLWKKSISPHHVTISIEHIYAPKIRQGITALVNPLIAPDALPNFDPACFFLQLKKAYPLVESLEWHAHEPRNAILSISGAKPVFLATGFVVGDNCKLYPKEMFEEYALTSLHHITLPLAQGATALDRSLYDFVRDIPLSVWQSYTITYERPTHIYLQPKNNDSFAVVADEKSIVDMKKFAQVERVYQELQKKGDSGGGASKERLWVFDVRFKDRVIAQPRALTRKGRR